MTIWDHLFPPFDSWWPNIIAAFAWATPTFVLHHALLRRHHRRSLVEHAAQVRAAFTELREQVGAQHDEDLHHRGELHAVLASVATGLEALAAQAQPAAAQSQPQPTRRRKAAE